MTSTELTIIEGGPGYVIPADSFTTAGGLRATLEKIAADVRAVPTDISTDKGRKAIASLAYKVARSKTAIDDAGKALVEEVKRKTAAIDAERRSARDFLDALKDEVRRPLDEYEAAERARIDAHEAALAAIPEEPGYGTIETSDELSLRLHALRNYPARDWQEFRARFDRIIASEIERTEALHAVAVKREAEAAELARLRAEEERRRQEEAASLAKEAAERAERERLEREARIAEQARIEAEQRAAREAEEAARRVEEERQRAAREAAEREAAIQRERERAEREKIEAERRAQEAEAARIEAARQAEIRRQQQAEQAERDRIAAEEAAALRERQRIESERQAEAEAQRRREADRAHKAKINGEAVAALVTAGLSEAAAKSAIIAIAKGEVPHVRISY